MRVWIAILHVAPTKFVDQHKFLLKSNRIMIKVSRYVLNKLSDIVYRWRVVHVSTCGIPWCVRLETTWRVANLRIQVLVSVWMEFCALLCASRYRRIEVVIDFFGYRLLPCWIDLWGATEPLNLTLMYIMGGRHMNLASLLIIMIEGKEGHIFLNPCISSEHW